MEQPGAGPRAEAGLSWREQAVARSLDPARARAEKRVKRFLDAALELMNDGTSKDFTVQEVVERSGQSLRSFYQYFGGKHQLLLALFEETVRSAAAQLRDAVAEEDDPLERLHRFVVEYYRLCRGAPKRKSGKRTSTPPLMVEFAQQLLTAHRTEAARAFSPVVAVFREVLDGAAAAGALRPTLRQERIAGVVLEAVMFNAFSSTIAGQPEGADPADDMDGGEELWDLVFNGIGAARR